MAATKILQSSKVKTAKSIWIGRTLHLLTVLFLLFDSISKILKESHSVEGTVQLGWPEQSVPVIGFILLSFTILYIFPHTSVIGALFLTAYLGGATATMMKIDVPFFFPIAFAVLIWTGLYFRDQRVRRLFSFKNENID